MQVFAAALAVLPKALARAAFEAEDVAPVAAAALQLLFVIALDWEQGSRRSAHARSAHLQERLLPEQGAWPGSVPIPAVCMHACMGASVCAWDPSWWPRVVPSNLHACACCSVATLRCTLMGCAGGVEGQQGQEASQPGWASQVVFSWVSPLMRLGSQRPLQQDDLLPLPLPLRPAECRRLLWGHWSQARRTAAAACAKLACTAINTHSGAACVFCWRCAWVDAMQRQPYIFGSGGQG